MGIVRRSRHPGGLASGDISGVYPSPTVKKASNDFALPGDISPAQITANQNDYNPTSLSTASTLRVNSDAARDVTGLQGGADGRLLIIHNTGGFGITFKDENASSSAANRFALSADLVLATDQACLLQYDSTSSRWRLVAGPSSGGGGGGTINATDGLIPYRSNSTTFADSPLTRDSASAVRISNSAAQLTLGVGANNVGLKHNASDGLDIVTNAGGLNTVNALVFQTGDPTNDQGGRLENGAGLILSASGHGGQKMGWGNGFFDTDSAIRNERLIRVNGATNSGNATLMFPAYSPAQITANQNDYNGSGQTNYFIRLNSDASRNVTGFQIPAGGFGDRQRDGEIHLIYNVGSFNIVLTHQDAASTAGNRFLFSTGANITLAPNQSVKIIYDGTTARWRDY